MLPIQTIASALPAKMAALCHRWSLDLTAGCQHGCLYCPFQRYQELLVRRQYGSRAVARRLSLSEFLAMSDYPSELLLSGQTDPCAPAARDGLERVLQRVLPLGVRVEVVTKGVVSPEVMMLLAASAEHVHLGIGVASLDEKRNAAVEPGCPPAGARLANLQLARACGLDRVTVRLDPLLPGVDDEPERLRRLLDEIARLGARTVVASYLFVTLRTDRERLNAMPYLGKASDACTEAGPVQGTRVLSVPLQQKLEFYGWMQAECDARGLGFATCGCKDLRLGGTGFGSRCGAADHRATEARDPRDADVARAM